MMSVRQRCASWFVFPVLAFTLFGALLHAAEPAAESRMRRDITFLASDQCEGRGVGTHGINLAADYIADQLKQAGLNPAGKGGSYFQPFTINGRTLEGKPMLALQGPKNQDIKPKLDKEFAALGLTRSGTLDKVPLVFAGYGLTVTKDNQTVYDDYKDLDVDGKAVVIIRDLPPTQNGSTPIPGVNPRMRSLATKLSTAEKHGARAVLFVNTAQAGADGDDLMVFQMTATDSSTSKLPAFQVKRLMVDTLLKQSTDIGLHTREQEIERTAQPQSCIVPDWTVSLDVHVKSGVAAKNIVGVLDGAGPLANETVVVGAHYDHLGFGGSGSLARLSKPAIHHGADDNGSGTTAVIELARRFGEMSNRQGRRLVFILFSGEELGLLGSLHYCKEPIFPLESTVAMVNLDMVGRLVEDKETHKGKLLVYGAGTAKSLDRLVDDLQGKYNLELAKKHDVTFMASDHFSFYSKKVPVLFFFTGDHDQYHRPSDTADRINVVGMREVVDLTEDILKTLTTTTEKPQYVALGRIGGGYGGGPRLGIRPAYGDEKEGVLLEGVVDGGPAAKAGMKAGDRIVQLNGKEVKSLEAYMSLMAGQGRGQAIEFQVLRDGKKIPIKVTPE